MSPDGLLLPTHSRQREYTQLYCLRMLLLARVAIFDTITMLKLYILYFVSISTLGYKSDKSFTVNIRKSCWRCKLLLQPQLMQHSW